MSKTSRPRSSYAGIIAALATCWQFAPLPLKAATYVWDPAGNQSNSGGVGSWDLSSFFWNDDASAPNIIWPNAADSIARFHGGGGDVTITGGTGVTANGLEFLVDGYIIKSAVLADSLNLAGTAPTLSVANLGHTATIQSVITGNSGLVKTGAGRLVLSGVNTYTGGTTVSAGILQAAVATGVNPLSTGAITLSGGTLALDPTANTSTQGASFRIGGGGTSAVSSVNFGTLTSVVTGTAANLNLPSMSTGTALGPNALPGQVALVNYGVEFRGKVNLTTGGSVTFALASDDASRLFIDGVAVINNDIGQGITTPVTNTITLSAGLHDIRILSGQGTGGAGVTLTWIPPGGSSEALGTTAGTLYAAESVSAGSTSNAIVLGNNVGLTASSSIDFGTNANFTEVAYGSLTRATGTTLTVNGLAGKLLRFTGTTLNGGGLHTYDSPMDVAVGQISDGGTTATIVKTGTGRLVFDQVTAVNSLGATSIIRIDQGSVVGMGSTAAGANNPFGSAQIQLNGGNLVLDSYVGGPTFNNIIAVNQSGRISAQAVAAQVTILGGTVSLANGTVLTLDPAGNTTTGTGARGAVLRLNGVISGAGSIVQNSSSYGLVAGAYTRGEVFLAGANTFSGGYTALSNSIIRLGVNSAGTYPTITSGAFGTGVLTLGAGLGGTTTITSIDATARSVANEIEFLDNLIAGSGTTFTGTLAFSGPADLNGAVRTMTTNVQTTFSGVISSSSSNATAGILKTGASILQLDGDNTFGGGVNFSNANNGGAIRVGHDNALGTGTLVFDLNTNNSTIFFRASTAAARVLNNAVTITGANTNAPIVFGAAGSGALEFNGNWDLGTAARIFQMDSNVTIDGVISNTANYAKRGFSTLTLTGANTYTGSTTVHDGALVVAGNDASISGSSSIFVQNRITTSGSSLVIGSTSDAVAGALNRLGNAAGITFNTTNGGGNMGNVALTYNGPASVGSGGFIETIGNLAFQGGGLVTLTLNPASGQELTLSQTAGGTWTNSGTTVLVRGTNLGSAPGPDTTRLILGSVPVTRLTGGILSSVIASPSATGTGTTFVTYDAVNGLRALTDAEYSASLVADDDISLSASTSLADDLAINSLRFTAGGVNLDLGGNRLWVKSGNVLFNGASTISNGVLDFGVQTGSVSLMGGASALNPVTLSADLYGMRGLNFASDLLTNRAILSGDNRRLLGAVTVANLTVTLGSTHALNDFLPQDLNIAQSGAILQLGGNNTLTGSLNRGLVDGTGSGAIIENASANAATLTLQQSANGTFGGTFRNGAGGGSLSLVKTGAGTLDVQGDSSQGTVNGMTGTLSIKRGILQLFRAGDFDDVTAINIMGGGTLRLANRASPNNNTDRLLDSAPVNMSGGTFDFDNDAAAATNFAENVGTLNILAGANTVRSDRATTNQTTTLTFSQLNGPALSGGSTLNFTGDGAAIGDDTRNRIVFTTAPTIPTANNSLVGGWAFVNGTDFAIYNTTGTVSIRSAQAANYQTGAETTWTFDQNAAPAADVTTTASRNVNVLKLGDGIDILMAPTHALNIELGGLVKSGTTASVIRGGTLTAGNTSAQNLYIFTSTGLTLDTDIIDNSGGAVGLAKSGGSTLTLTGANSHTGGTFLNEGTLIINADARLGAASSALHLRGGTLQVGAGATGVPSLRPLILARSVTINDAGGTIDIGTANTVIIDGTLSGTGDRGTLGLVKTGAGTLVLAGNNTFTAPVTVTAGVLSISADANLGTAPTTEAGDWLTLNGGTLNTTASFTLHANRGVNVATSSTLDVATGTVLNIGGVLTGTATLTKANNGQLNLQQGLMYQGSIIWQRGSGSLAGARNDVLASFRVGDNTVNTATDVGAATVTYNTAGGILTVGSGSSDNLDVGVRSGNVAGITQGKLDLSGTSMLNANVARVRIGVEAGGNGSGDVSGTLLLGTNATIVASVEVLISDSNAVGIVAQSVVQTGSGSTVIQTPTMTVGGRKGFATFTVASGGTLTLDAGAAGATDLYIGRNPINTATWSRGLLDVSAGTFVASLDEVVLGDMGSSGNTGVATGVLLAGSSAGNQVTANSVVLGRMGASSSRNLAGETSGTLVWGGGNLTVAGDVALGVDLGGNVGGYVSGVLTVNGGVVTIGGNITHTASASSRGLVNLNGGQLDMTSGSIAANTFAHRGGLLSNVSSVTVSAAHDAFIFGDINVNYSVNVTSTGSANYSYVGTGAGATYSNGIDFGNYYRDFVVADSAGAAADLTVSGVLTGSGGFSKLGAGTMVLTAGNTYTGRTQVLNGTLVVGDGGTSGSLGSSTAPIVVNGQLVYNRTGVVTLANQVTGYGSLNQTGTGGTLVLTGANNYMGTTFIGSGSILQVGDGGAAGTFGGGNVENNGSLILNRSDSFVVGNAISGSGTLTKNGAGVVTLELPSTYTGATSVTAGTLAMGRGARFYNGANALASSMLSSGMAVDVASGATFSVTDSRNRVLKIGSLTGTGNVVVGGATASAGGLIVETNSASAITFGGVMQNSAAAGFFVKAGIGEMILTGSSTYTGFTRVDDGTLTVNAATGALADVTALVMSNRSTAVLNVASSETVGALLGGGRNMAYQGVNTFAPTPTSTAPQSVASTGGGSATINIASGQALTSSTTTNSTFGGIIAGAGSLTITGGSHNLLLYGASTFTGGLRIGTSGVDGGNVYLGVAGRATGAGAIFGSDFRGSLADNLVITFENRANTSFNLNSASETIGNITGGGSTGGSVGLGTGLAVLTLSDGNGTYGGVISGNGGVIKQGTGTLTLAGNSTFTGFLRISGGRLDMNATLSDALQVIVESGAEYRVLQNDAIASLEGAGTVNLNGGTARTLTLANPNGKTFTGNIVGTGGLLTVGSANNWGGSITLSGANTYTGATTVTNATMILDQSGTGGNNILGATAMTFNGATIDMRGLLGTETAGNTTLGAGASTILRWGTAGFENHTARLTLGAITRNAGSALYVYNTSAETTQANAAGLNIVGGYAVYEGSTWAVANGAGVAISGLASGGYSADTFGTNVHTDITQTQGTAATQTGTLRFNTNAGGAIELTLNANMNVSGGGILVTANVGANTVRILKGGAATTLGSTGSTDLVVHQMNPYGDLEIDAVITGGSAGHFTKSGNGRVILTGANTYAGTTYILGGVLQIGNGTSGSISAASLIDNRGWLVFNTAAATDQTGVISGYGWLEKTGTNIVNLNATNTYTGRTRVLGGTLQTNNVAGFGSAANNLTTVASGATLSYVLTGAGNVDENIHLLGGTLAVGGTGDPTFRTLLGLSADSTISVAAGRTAFFNTASFLQGGVEADGTLADLTVQGGGIVTIQGTSNFGDLAIKGNSTVNVGLNSVGNIGSAVYYNNGSAGAISIEAGSTFALRRNFDSGFHHVVSGGGTLAFIQNTNYVSQNNSGLTGFVTLGVAGSNNAAVHLGMEGFSGDLGTATVTITSNGANASSLRVNRMDNVVLANNFVLNAATSNAQLVKNLPNVVEFSGSITAGSATTTDGQTARVFSQAGYLRLTGDFIDSTSNALRFENNSVIDFAGSLNRDLASNSVISGGGLLIHNGTGITTLQANNTYTGSTVVNRGTLVFDRNGGAIADTNALYVAGQGMAQFNFAETLGVLGSNRGGRVVLNNGAVLTISGAVGTTATSSFYSGTISDAGVGTGSLVKNNTGTTLSLYGTSSSFGGGVDIRQGTVEVMSIDLVGASSSLGTGGTVILGNGADTGTLRYLGAGNTASRTFQLAGAAGGGIIEASGTGALVFNASSAVSATTANAKTFTLGGNTGVLAAVGPYPAIINVFGGVISDGSAVVSVTKSGTSVWELSNANTYTGATTIGGGGGLRVTANNALGTAAGVTTLNNATLDLVNVAYTTAEALTMNNAAAVLRTSSGTSTFAGAITLNVAGTIQVDTGASLQLNGAVGGNFALTKSGNGLLIFNNDLNALNSGFTINSGTVRINSGSTNRLNDALLVTLANTLGTGAVLDFRNTSETIGRISGQVGTTVTLDGTALTLSVGTDTTFNGVVQNGTAVGSVIKAGANRQDFNGLNTYTGSTTINAGTLRIWRLANNGSASGLGMGGAVPSASDLVINGGTLEFLALDPTTIGNTGFTSFSTNREFTVGASGATINNGSASPLATYSFTNATGAVAMAGAGSRTLTLGGANTGGTTGLSAGLNGNDNFFRLSIGDGPTPASDITSLTKANAGTWVLTRSNTYSGITTITDGILVVTQNNGLGNATGGTTINGTNANLEFRNVTYSTAEALTVTNGSIRGTGISTFAGDVALAASSHVVNVLSSADSLTLTGVISGNAASGNPLLMKRGLGTLVLAGQNTFLNATAASDSIRVEGGTLALDYTLGTPNTSRIADTAIIRLGGNRSPGATLELRGGSHTEIIGGLSMFEGAHRIIRTGVGATSKINLNTIGRATGATLNIGENDIATTDNTNTNGIIGGWITVNGKDWAYNSGVADGDIKAFTGYSNDVWLHNSNVNITANATESGQINSLRFAAATNITLNLGAVILDSGGLLVSSDAGASNILLSGGTITVNAGAPNVSNFTVIHNGTGILEINSSIINNAGTAIALTKAGTGTLVLSGDNTFSARSFITAGTVQIGNGGATGTLGSNAMQVDLFTGATLRWNTTTDQTYSGALVSLATVDLDANTPGGGLVIKDNTNALTFSGDNSTYSGVIRVNAGRLVANHNSALGAAGSFYTNTGYTEVNAGGAVEILNTRNSGESILMNNGGRLLISTTTTAVSGTFSGAIKFAGANNLIEAQTNTTLTMSGALLGSGGFTKSGNGILVLSGSYLDANTLGSPLTGKIIAAAGILRAGTVRGFGAGGVGNETVIQAGATFDLNDQDLNVADETATTREIFQISGTGIASNYGAITNFGAGSAFLSHIELVGHATVGGSYLGTTDGRLDGRATVLSAFDIDPNANWHNWQQATLNGGGFNLTKIGANAWILRNVDITNLGTLTIAEGRIFLDEMRVVDAAASDAQLYAPTLLKASQIQRVVVAYGGPTVDAVTNTLNPIFGAKLVFNNQSNTVGQTNDVPITLNDGYIEVRGDTVGHSDVASGRAPVITRLSGEITLAGDATKNFFNIEGGNFTTSGAGPTALGGTLSEVPNKLVISGTLVGSSGFAKVGGRELRLTGNNTYTGATYLTRSASAVIPFYDPSQGYADNWGTVISGPNGALTATSKVQFERNAHLMLDNSNTLDASSGTVTVGPNGNRINDSADLVMNGGFLEIRPFNSGATTESLATTGGAALRLNSGTNFIDFDLFDQASDLAQSLTLTVGSISRSQGAVLKFRSFDATSTFSTNTTGDNVRVVVSNTAGLSLVGTGSGLTDKAVARGIFGGIAPYSPDFRLSDYLTQERNRQFFTGTHFMTLDAGNVLRPLNSNEYATSLISGQNVNLNEMYTVARTSMSINALRFGNLQDHNFTGAYGQDQSNLLEQENTTTTLAIDDGATLTIASGMIVGANMGSANNGTTMVIFGEGTLDFGTNEAIIQSNGGFFRPTDGTFQGQNMEIRARIAGSGGLTKTGLQNLVLHGASAYTGNTYVSEGTLISANNKGIGNSQQVFVDGSGSFILAGGTNQGAGAKVTARILNGDQIVLRSLSGNGQLNTWAGDVEIDNVDALGHALFTPRLRAETNSVLRIEGNIYGGNTAITNDLYFSDSRILSTASDQTGNIFLFRGQIRDKSTGAVSGTVTLQPTGAGLVNENEVFRLHLGGRDDTNAVMYSQYNAAGRLILDRGYLRIAYDPTAVGNDGTGFWTDTALSRIPNGNSNALLQNAADPTSGMTGFILGTNITEAGGTSRLSLLLTQDQQRFNMGLWRVNNSSSGTFVIGGENTSGTVFYGNGSAQSTIELNSRGIHVFAGAGGTVDFQTRFNRVAGNGGFTKVGRGTVIMSGSLAGASSADRLAVRSGRLVFDYGTGSTALNNNRVDAATQLTLGGGTLHLLGNDQATTTQTMTGTIAIARGGSEVAVESRSSTGAFNTTLTIGGGSTGLSRAVGGTVNFVEIDPLAGGSAILTLQTNTAGFMDSFLGWATYGDALGQANDFAIFNSTGSVRVVSYARPAGSEKNDVSTWLAAENVSEQNTAGSNGFSGTLGASLAVNSIHFDVAADSTINLGANNLTVSSGGILVSTQVGGANKTITGSGSLTGTATELILHHYGTGTLDIAAPISGASYNLVINGAKATSGDPAEVNSAGVVRLSAANTFSGKTLLNGAILAVDNIVSRLGADPGSVVADQLYFNGGALRFTGTTSNNSINLNRGITLGSSGGVLEVSDPNGILVLRSVIAPENGSSQGDGDLIIRANGAVQFGVATSAADTQDLTGVSNTYSGLTVVEKGTVIVEGTPNDGSTITPFGTSESYIDSTVFKSGTNLIIRPHVGDGSRDSEVKTEEWFVFEGNNVLTTGGIDSNGVNSTRQIRLNGVLDVRGTLTLNTISELVLNFDGANGFLTGNGTIIKQGASTVQFRENSPDWKGQLIINEGRVLAGSQGNPLGTGTLPILMGNDSMPAGGSVQLMLHPENGWGNYEINQNIVVRYSPLQEKRIGAISISDSHAYSNFAFNGNIELNDNVTFMLEDSTTAPGGNYVHIAYNGNITDGAATSGNILFRVTASDSTAGEMWSYFYLNGNNSGWTGDAIISGNTSYDDDQNAIVRLGNINALSAANDVIMNFNSRLQIAGFNTTIGSLWTQAGTGVLSTEVIENGSNTSASLTITQTTPSTYEAQWDALFQDGNLASHLVRPDEAQAGTGKFNLVKAGDGWATLTVNNGYTGTTTVAAGVLQVGRGGIGDTGADNNAGGIVVQTGATLAGTGVVQGKGTGFTQHLVSGNLKPGDLAGESTGTLTFNGNTKFENATVSLQIFRASFVDYGLTAYDLNNDGLVDSTYDSRVVGLPSTYSSLLAEPVTPNAHDHLEINGTLTVTGTKFSIVNTGYSAQIGDVFNLMDWVGTLAGSLNVGDRIRVGGETGTDLDLPTLGGGYRWDTSLFASQGILIVTAVPEPGRALLILLGLLMITRRRRR
ncbi:autotransporter-associated beta strand repeat-containing protein [Verrucomicrobium sp. BvORR034]|uniref:autotransporter-associated beta strand repeat-containing protein n=1 Tax=Verrucomicrobium sp. BvORR034 TaxID=1396418 RepID=UPI000678650F|nr:autotransporter-associated beta strand repeat-containing protein [Verrucomicrobium sp. BvORR034]